MKLNRLNPFYILSNFKRIPDSLKYRTDKFLRTKHIGLSANDGRIAKLRNAHRGERAFIIGNGPSLTTDDLSLLKNEITFASNKIYLAFESTEWRPTYYSIVDVVVAENIHSHVEKLELNKIFADSVQSFIPRSASSTHIPDSQEHFSENLLFGAGGGATVIFLQLQLALYMGIKEIYLIGLDYSFDNSKMTGEKSVNGEVLLEQQDEKNHFHKDYRLPGEKWTFPKLDMQYDSFKVADEVYRKKGGKILNASRKTKLDVFPRVNFDEIL